MFKNLKTAAALALSAAMLLATAACGTTDTTTDSTTGTASNATEGYDLSGVKTNDAVAALLPSKVKSAGKLTVGMELSYAPAEFLAEDGKTPVGYDVDIATAIGKIAGVKTEIVSSTFDSIVPSVGSKYDLGITAMTITKERLEAVDFVSYYKSGFSWIVKKGNPNKVDTTQLCGLKIAVQTGTVQEEEANKAAEQCKADGKDATEVLSTKLQTDAATSVVTGKADVFYADSPVGGYAISQTGGELEMLGDVEGTAKQGVAIAKGDEEMDKFIQAAVQELMDDGTYGKILKHWGVESGAIDKAEINPTDLA
ncbi:ABC transporter substrate-binding protein [Bifidobacterium biavatii]|uniref:ABC transporter substrate-binding protein n=1 Tax=Bifidobacterium biavatii DSM 23969 TaxID=1437608 RepID=A0A087A2S8_9BIFI|nr:ABC transporter substrate-binding protein [Bifidobacterium biavatii]KFI53078.1 ABC transporter substrate-binding protein [Bifidobacterium biavatii DSM 23969]